MRYPNKHAIAGLLAGILVSLGGFGIYAHAGHLDGHGMHDGNRHSITGSPAELAQRARELGLHICEHIKAATDCAVTAAADAAFNELNVMQDPYQNGQVRLHELLTSANFDRSEFARIETEQAQAIQSSATRYMEFLADAATALTPEQRQMFSRKGHAAQ